MPCVGVGVTLEMNLGWPSLVMRAAALGTRPCDGIWRTEVDVEWLVQVTIDQDDVWEVIGPSSQLVRLPITSIDSTAAMCQLKWKLVRFGVATCYSSAFTPAAPHGSDETRRVETWRAAKSNGNWAAR